MTRRRFGLEGERSNEIGGIKIGNDFFFEVDMDLKTRGYTAVELRDI